MQRKGSAAGGNAFAGTSVRSPARRADASFTDDWNGAIYRIPLRRFIGFPDTHERHAGRKTSKEGMPVAQIAAGIVLGGIAYAAVILTLIHALRRDSGDVTDLSEEAYRIVSK